jgi:dienelactone hydrolase
MLARAFAEHGKAAQLIVFPGAGHGFTYLGAPRAKCCNYDPQLTASTLEAVAQFMRTARVDR